MGSSAATARITALTKMLRDQENLHDDAWGEALCAVPRELFVPSRALALPDVPDGQAYPIDKDARPDEWWNAVYSDTSIITQIDDSDADSATGADRPYTSSTSAPGVVVTFLELLELKDEHRVLEIGTGTGWNAALLAHRLGADNVVTVEVDPHVADQALVNLRTHFGDTAVPRAMIADGADGAKTWAPYDRVIATCAVSRIPPTWVEQTRPGGKIVTPFKPGYGYGYQLVLDVIGDGTAVGRFAGPAGYMMMRSHRPEAGRVSQFLHHEDEAERAATAMDPRGVVDAGPGADLAISALVPGVRRHLGMDEKGGTGEATLWLVETTPGAIADGSWAVVEYVPGQAEYQVEQYGPRRLWDEVSDAYLQWLSWGRPGRHRFGCTITNQGQHFWLDSPQNLIGDPCRRRSGTLTATGRITSSYRTDSGSPALAGP